MSTRSIAIGGFAKAKANQSINQINLNYALIAYSNFLFVREQNSRIS